MFSSIRLQMALKSKSKLIWNFSKSVAKKTRLHPLITGGTTMVFLFSTYSPTCSPSFRDDDYVKVESIERTQQLPLRYRIEETLFSIFKFIQRQINLIWRAGRQLLVFSPAFITLPMIYFIGSENFWDWWWAMMKSCIRTSGPCGTKFAQWIATRPDLFPLDICIRLQELQSLHCECNWSNLKKTLERELGTNMLRKLIVEKQKTSGESPVILGTGCVATVLRGTLVNEDDGKDVPVAIKVINDGVREAIATDIEIFRFLTWLAELIPGVPNLSLRESVEEFSSLMTRQLDMRIEAANLMQLRKNFHVDSLIPHDDHLSFSQISHHKPSSITFPRPMNSMVTENVLVESFEEGELISSILDNPNISPKQKHELAIMGLDAVLQMVFQDNFIHADLHPGNIICRRRPCDATTKGRTQEWELSMIDAGIVAILEPQDRKNFLDLFTAVVLNDGKRVGELMIERSRGGRCIDPDGFASETRELVAEVHRMGLSLGKIGIGALLQRMLVLCYKHQVKLESRFASVIISLGVVEGLGRQLDKDVDVLRRATPFVLKAVASRTF